MYKITITAGVGFTADGSPIDAGKLAMILAELRVAFARQFGGYTETTGHGGWVDDAGALVEEESRQWTILTDRASSVADAQMKANQMAAFIAAKLDQQAVMAEACIAQSCTVRRIAARAA